ncbi:hypothetical protein [Paenibacillus sp. CF384]|uniref:hypothetical protein n=1 Tax=Paenibacillus sp. CF384 TaxID=1884382 RepID=UPI00089B663D|nr:hypothetical protein [Paenibacillus sp. CF384]SDW05792.1 hypothetical protein SAMN05518855_1001114 [Paenibacillus sp. CF384]
MKLSFRIGVSRYEREDQFQELLTFLLRHRNCVDELTLFTEYWHYGYYPLGEFAKRCDILKNRMERLRFHGFRNVGMNMLSTLGHMPEAWDWLPELPHQGAVGWDGKVSTCSFCPNSAEFRTYIGHKYTMAALAQPAFIWLDDDLRMFGIGVDYACFCDTCIGIYNDGHQTAYTREELVGVLNSPEGKTHREHWVQQNIATIESLLQHIAETVRKVDPRIELGLMTVSLNISTYTGADYEKWFSALRSTKGRPGGGFFDDAKPFGLIRKAHEVNRQIAHYPEAVKDIQYELENFPYHRLSKSVHIAMLECTVSIASGTNGVAFNALKGEEGSLAEFHEIMDAIEANKPLWTAMDRIAGNYVNAGLYPALSPLYEARRNVNSGGWFEPISVDNAPNVYVLSEIGIPLSMDGDRSCTTVLSGTMAEGYTTEELLAMLSRGVLMDGKTVEILTAQGLGDYCGVAIDRKYDNGVYERFSSDPMNNGFAYDNRDARNSLSKEQGYVLKPLYDEVRVLSRLISYTNEDVGPTSTIYENALGGRVAVQGYVPWQLIHSGVKRTQLLRICDWLWNERLPVVIDRCLKVVPFFKQAEDGSGWLLLLLNGSFDETGSFETKLRIGDAKGVIYELLADGSSVPVAGAAFESSKGEVVLKPDNIGSWKFRIFYQM